MSRIYIGLSMTLILIAVSFFTSKTYSLGLRLDTVATRIAFIVFLIIPFLFMGSILLSRNDTVGPILYREIQILAGIGFYLFMGSMVLALCLIISKIISASFPVWAAWTVLIASLGLAGIGFVQSRFIKAVQYSVTLPSAPASWNNKTAVLVSDTHFGLVNHKKFSDKVVDAISALHPDFVLHAGDFYDGPRINTAPISESWRRLASTTPVYMAPGNHEEYGDYSGFITSIKNAGIHVLDDKVELYDGVQIAGIMYRGGKDPAGAVAALKQLSLDQAKTTILINHPPTSLAAATKQGVDLQVSGHTHNGQFWPMTYLIRRINGPYYHGLAGYEDMQVLTTSGVGTFGPPFRLFNPPELVVITFSSST